ncbi:hypothetical protein ACGFNV_10765 [Streptomyces sp. NPDC048751]|uniref:hypothetical protein n=1 Tax=Streptomyces sp. NPDC048751 TaxID=3365591 RepID=UPI00371A0857
MYKRRRLLGTYLGAALAIVLLPGISPVLDDPPWELILCGSVFLIVNQLIHCYPSNVRSSPVVVFAAIGIVQDTLIWFLVSWISGHLDIGVHVDGFLAALLGGVIVRVTTLAVMAIGPQPTPAT